MARKKTITREQILTAAYEVVATEGFAHFTARNIAKKMKCSTQPIYLEFKNMDDLKNALFEKIEIYLEKVFSKTLTGEPFIDMALNYIHFAQNEKVLYRALYVEGHSAATHINQFSKKMFMKKMSEEDNLKKLDAEKKEALFSSTWIVATGIASLSAGGLITMSDEQIIAMLKAVMPVVLADDQPSFFD